MLSFRIGRSRAIQSTQISLLGWKKHSGNFTKTDLSVKFPELSPTTWSGTDSPCLSVWAIPAGNRELRGANIQWRLWQARCPGWSHIVLAPYPSGLDSLFWTGKATEDSGSLRFCGDLLLWANVLPLWGAIVAPSPMRSVWDYVGNTLVFPEVQGVLLSIIKG